MHNYYTYTQKKGNIIKGRLALLYIYRIIKAERHLITGRERESFEAIIISFLEKIPTYMRFAAVIKSRAEKK